MRPLTLTPGQAIYLIIATERGEEAATLRAIWNRRKTGAEKHALWSGHYELKCRAENAIEDLVSRGALLFFGQQAALAEARLVNDKDLSRQAA